MMMVVGNEFAEVAVEVDDTANGPRLRLEDRRTGRAPVCCSTIRSPQRSFVAVFRPEENL